MSKSAWTFAALALLVACSGGGQRATTGAPLPPIGAAGDAAGSGAWIVVSLPAASAAPSVAPSIAASKAPGSGPAFGLPTLPSGVSGSCAAGIAFTGLNQVATLPVSDAGYFGGLTVASTAPAVAYATLSSGGVAITTLSAGAATITVTDAGSLTASCSVTVTLTSTMLQ